MLAAGLPPGAAATAEALANPATAQTSSDEAALSEEAARAQAERTGRSVEIASLRGESREVFATPDGELEAREYLRPIRARVNGEWKPVDTALTMTGEGAIAPKVTTVGLEFSGGGDTPLVRMNKAGRELALSWPGELPAPELDGDTATYRNVLPDIDLRMGAQEDGFTQLLVVNTAEAAKSEELAELRLKLAADGMRVRETANGGLEAVDDGAGSAVFEAPKPLMWDSSTGGGSGKATGGTAVHARAAAPSGVESGGDRAGADGEPGPGESGKVAPVEVDLPAGGRELVLRPDPEVLKGKDTAYPVFIDPQWYSPRASAWTMASKYWASSPQWKFNGKSDAGMGYCGWAYCAPQDTKRLFYRIPTSTFSGKTILSAEFVVRNVHSASCSAREVQLWRTKDISSSTTWNSQNASGYWIKKLATRSFAYGYSGCSAKDAEFDVKSAVQEAANGKWPTMTFGLRATSETDKYGWKRFSDKAFLRVKYNRPPPQLKMTQLAMEYGGTCKRPGEAARVRTLGKVYANNVTDPDGDSIAVEFQAKWDAGDGKGLIVRWNPARTSYKSSGSSFSVGLPASITPDKEVHWYVRSYDGAQYSPWSYAGDPTACYFVYDKSVPTAPVISSGQYPASDPENPDDPWYDGVGQYGTFSFDSASTDVVRYRFGFNSDPSSAHEITTSGGAARSTRLLPAKPGLNFVTVQAFDQAGNGSEIRTHQFRVKAGQPERAAWQLDEAAGATQAASTATSRTARLHGGAALGAAGAKGTGLHLDGTSGYAASDLTVVDTSDGFSVAAWARLDRMPSSAAIIAAQPGNHSPGFELYYSKYYDRWVFNQYTSDTAGAPIARAMATAPGNASAGEWTHLTGVYDGKARQLRLYVNGTLSGSTSYTTAWEARRGLRLGAGVYSGKHASFFPGTIDDVQIFDRAVTATEAAQLHQGQAPASGRPARAVFPLDEEAAAGEVTGRAAEQPLTLHGDTTAGADGIAGKALRFDGSSGYAATSRPVLNTARSYTVSAWAKLPQQGASGNRTVVSQSGTYYSPFYLSYEAGPDTWSLRTSLEDVEAGNIREQVVRGTQPARPGEWTHLVAVHDATARQIRLYVDGRLQGTDDAPKTWEANGPVQVGRTIWTGRYVDYFPGSIDDVRLFDRPVADDEVRQMFQQRPLVKSRWTFEETAGTAPVTTPDSAPGGSALTLNGGAAKSDSGFIDFGSLELDGVDGHASTATVPVDTSASYTVTAWAQAAALPEGGVSLVSAEGATQSAFSIRFVPDANDPDGLGHWELALPDRDAADTSVVRVANSEFYDARDWNHLAVVYDGFAKQARLYVNGILQQAACGDGTAEAECRNRASWSENTLTFKAARSLQIGRAKVNGAWGEHFPGLVDDVWTFQGALTDSQVEELAGSWFDIPTQVPQG
ncbi:DNRLRE domain-containing protein [Streptomyces sp. C10-9-1]|uniref:LamG-like jellyroll fold domain-containing protein n=1 Tax=Streptomyces sp. C10-9-1 TaxID=1859285 RepID=UPI002112E9C6|nr:LamG-like jellyroll fold domain-containing protein [Streptomyces sp. C10-9-1]MCQ6555765.1 DNRLRE domain-containing protein [Streptomyces sp. C10-9-1]